MRAEWVDSSKDGLISLVLGMRSIYQKPFGRCPCFSRKTNVFAGVRPPQRRPNHFSLQHRQAAIRGLVLFSCPHRCASKHLFDSERLFYTSHTMSTWPQTFVPQKTGQVRTALALFSKLEEHILCSLTRKRQTHLAHPPQSPLLSARAASFRRTSLCWCLVRVTQRRTKG